MSLVSSVTIASHEPTADMTKVNVGDAKEPLTGFDSSLNPPVRRFSTIEGPVKRRSSVLQRMKVAPLDIVPINPNQGYNPEDLPARSPKEGIVRSHSGLTNRKIGKKSLEELKAAAEEAAKKQAWHKMSGDELYAYFGSRDKGLTSEEVLRARETYGLNEITPPPKDTLLKKFLRNIFSGFSILLELAGILAFIIFAIEKTQQNFFDVQTLALAVSLFIVVIVTAAFATFQEGKAADVMESLHQLSAESVYALRDGQQIQVPSAEIVPGDVVLMGTGEKIPADLRILDAQALKVNNAPLTGESIEINLGTEPNHDLLFEARNVARSGCNFTSGKCKAIVFATGDNTFLGKIAKATVEAETPDTLLKREVRRIIFFMTGISIGLAAIILALSLSRGDPWYVAIVYVIGVLIANVPEGLLPQITVALTLTAKRMLKKGALVSNLEIIETLGAVTVICSDKTGTITCNRMTVSHLYYGGAAHRTPWTPGAEQIDMFNPKDPNFQRLLQIIMLNTDATFTTFEDDVLKRTARGDASETALIKFAEPIFSVDTYRKVHPRVTYIPFNSGNKFMASVNRVDADGNGVSHRIFLKGAAERVLPRCVGIHTAQGLIPFNDSHLAEVDRAIINLASLGERVLCFAEMPFSVPAGATLTDENGDPEFPLQGFNFVGLVSLVDPPRPSVRPAIDECRSAGIRVIMVTGDHPATAAAICKSLGYEGTTVNVLERTPETNPDDTFCVVHGINDIPKFTPEDWEFAFKSNEVVFARTMPEQKQTIVHELLKLGHVVAMTGDGVNDASALKVAHVGIAMGSGSAVARDASQCILLNDDFGNIVDGVREGRLIFENLKKAVAYVLCHLVPEYLPFLMTVIIGFPLGLQTLIILVIDLGTELFPGVMLAYEEPEDRIMRIPPRRPDSHLASLKMVLYTYTFIGVAESFCAFWGFIWVFYSRGFTISQMWNTNNDLSANNGWGELSDSTKMKWLNLCQASTAFPNRDQCTAPGVAEQFYNWGVDTFHQGQSVYFLHLVWFQITNVFMRRTQVNSGVTWSRLKSNPRLFVPGVLSSIIVAIIAVFLPGLHRILQLDYPSIALIFTGIWMLPIALGLEELRKYFIRRNPTGIVAKLTLF